MTDINRRKLARHYNALGKKDHPYCLEFPDEVAGPAETAEAQEAAKKGLVCVKCSKVCKTPQGLNSHMLACKGG